MTATVNDQSITITDESLTVSESVGIYECDFTFDASWDTWNKTAVFEGAGATIEMIVVDNKARIPWEVLKEAGWIKIGVYGTSGGEIKPTIWSDQIYVAEGTVPGSVEVTPTPSIYAQILDLANDAKDIAEDAQDTADDVASDWTSVSATATTLSAGSPATATFSDNTFAFGIPKGAKGDTGATGATGATPDFSIGTVSTLETGQSATATITGTAAAPVLNLGLPKGNKGDNGDVANIADAYSTSATYAVGDYCIYSSQLYRCTTAITTAEAWTAAHWSAVELGEDVSTLRSALNTQMAEVKSEISYPLNIYKRIQFANGSYKTIGSWASGINDVATRIYGQVELASPVNSITITPTNASYNFEYALFDSENAKIVSSTNWNSQTFVYTGIVPVKTVRVDVRKTNNANISPTQDTGIVIGVNGATDLDAINAIVSNLVKTIKFDTPVRLRAMSNNVGKYNFGEGNGYSGADYADKFLEWKRRVGKNMPDFVMLQENVLYFDSGQNIMARDIWDPLFPYIASDSGSLGISIRSRYPLSNAQKITLETVESGVTYTRYLVVAEANIHGKKVAVAVTHLTPGYNSPYEEVRQSEAAQVITALSDYDNVILGGDFNTSDATTLGLFTTAGYTLGNNGYFGAIETLSGEYVDNIIIKGLSFYDVYSNASEAITSDHYPIVAEMMLP